VSRLPRERALRGAVIDAGVAEARQHDRVVDTLASGSIHFRQARFAVERERQAERARICEAIVLSWARCRAQRAQTPCWRPPLVGFARAATKDSAMSRTGSTPSHPARALDLQRRASVV